MAGNSSQGKMIEGQLRRRGLSKQTEKCYGFLHVHVYDSRGVGSSCGFIGVDFAGWCYYPSSTPDPFFLSTGDSSRSDDLGPGNTDVGCAEVADSVPEPASPSAVSSLSTARVFSTREQVAI